MEHGAPSGEHEPVLVESPASGTVMTVTAHESPVMGSDHGSLCMPWGMHCPSGLHVTVWGMTVAVM
jgi:hypothetical protein